MREPGPPIEVAVLPAPARPRRRTALWVVLGALGVLLVVAGVLVWLWVSGRAPVPGLDDAVRAEAVSRVQQEVAARLGIEPEDVLVDLGEAPILPQLERRVIDEASMTISVPAERAVPLIAAAAGLDPATLALGEGTVRLQTELDAVITKIVLGIGFAPSIEAGELRLTPEEFVLGGNPISLDALRDVPVVGEWVAPLLEPRAFCIASSIPAALELAAVEVTPARLELRVEGHDIPLDEAAITETDTCG